MLSFIIAVLATYAISAFVVREGQNMLHLPNRKPFNCFYCCTFWSALLVTVIFFPSMPIVDTVLYVFAIHAAAFILYIKTS